MLKTDADAYRAAQESDNGGHLIGIDTGSR